MFPIPHEKISKLIDFWVTRASFSFPLSKEDKEDITQNLWIKVLDTCRNFLKVDKNIGSGAAYLATVIKRELGHEIARLLIKEPIYEYIIENTEQKEELDYILDMEKFERSLKPRDAAIFRGVISGMTQDEAASLFGEKRSRQSIDKAMKRLRKKYISFFLEKSTKKGLTN